MTTRDRSEPPVFQVHNGFEVYPMPMFAAMETADDNALAQWPALGKAHVDPVTDTPWNTRQVLIVDPDGRLLVFSQPRFDVELTRRWRQALEADRGTRS